MLKLKYLFENYDLAKECLSLYDVDEETVDKMLTYFRISSNAIYPFRNKTGMVCFLRISPVEEKKEEDVSSEIQLIEWLIEQGFPAMKPYPMKDGRLLAVLDTKWGTVNVSCFEAVEGDTLEECEGSLELVRGYGRTLGQLHKYMKVYPYADTRRNHSALMDEIGDRFNKYHAPAKLIEEFKKVNDILKSLPINNENYGVVHYDFEPDNVLYCDTSDSFGVIDFDDAIRCWFALDVVRAIDALDDVSEDIDPNEMEAEFIAGYREVCLLSEEQLATIPVMRRFVHLQEYSTIMYVLSEPVEDEPQWMTEMISKLQYKLQCIEESIR